MGTGISIILGLIGSSALKIQCNKRKRPNEKIRTIITTKKRTNFFSLAEGLSGGAGRISIGFIFSELAFLLKNIFCSSSP